MYTSIDDGETVYKFKKHENAEIRARVRKYKGRDLLDLRLFVANEEGDKFPTKRGISLDFNQVEELKQAVAALANEVERRQDLLWDSE